MINLDKFTFHICKTNCGICCFKKKQGSVSLNNQKQVALYETPQRATLQIKKKKNQICQFYLGRRELDVWGSCLCVFLCLFNSKNSLSPTPFKNQYFFSKYKHILYNKMHKDNVYFQGAIIVQIEKKNQYFSQLSRNLRQYQ